MSRLPSVAKSTPRVKMTDQAEFFAIQLAAVVFQLARRLRKTEFAATGDVDQRRRFCV